MYIPEVMPALDVLELFREKKVHIGIVVNEFGTTEGLITLHDISESILGDFPALMENEPPEIFSGKTVPCWWTEPSRSMI